MKTCKDCVSERPVEEFYLCSKKYPHRASYCKDCHNVRSRVGRLRHKMAVFEAYGWVCANCGDGRLEHLSMDHINGKGALHRRDSYEVKSLYNWLTNNNFPDGFQILCFNCNCSKQFSGNGINIPVSQAPEYQI